MKQYFKILIVAVLACVPCFAAAQAKPKRNVARDRSEVAVRPTSRHSKQSTARPVKKADYKAAKRQEHKKVKTTQAAPASTWLLVNQQPALTASVGYKGGTETFWVSTNDKDWSVSLVPSWCKVVKYNDCFVLTYEENTSHEERTDWLKVRAGDKSVRVDIKQSGAPLNIVSQVNSVSLQHNLEMESQSRTSTKWLKVRANVTIGGAKGQSCLVVAFITDEYGHPIKASSLYESYATSDAHDVCASVGVYSLSDEPQSHSVILYLPNDAMLLPKRKNTLQCRIGVFCQKTGAYVSGFYASPYFIAKSKKGRVQTKAK